MPYSNYTISDLVEAQNSVCKQRYPDAAQQIDQAIQAKLAQGESLPVANAGNLIGQATGALLIDMVLLMGLIWVLLPEELDYTYWYLIGPLGIFYFSLSRGFFSASLGQSIAGIKLSDQTSAEDITFQQAIEKDLPLWLALAGLFTYLAWIYFLNQPALDPELKIVTALFFTWHLSEWIFNCFDLESRSVGDKIAKVRLIKG